MQGALRVAFAVRVYESDQALGLTVRRGHTVVALGYTGEPFLRIGAEGVTVNASSPTAAALGLLGRAHAAAPIASGWYLKSDRPTAIWHDARVRALPPGVPRRQWSIPLVVDGRRVSLEGEVWRISAPSLWPWLALVVPFVALTALLLVRGQALRRNALVALGVATATGTVAVAAVFALAASASAGTWIEGANEFVFVLVGLAVVARGSADARSVAGGALGLLGLSVGLSRVPVFLHGVVLSALPAAFARLSVAFTIAAGAAATAVGLAVFFDLLEPREQSHGVG